MEARGTKGSFSQEQREALALQCEQAYKALKKAKREAKKPIACMEQSREEVLFILSTEYYLKALEEKANYSIDRFSLDISGRKADIQVIEDSFQQALYECLKAIKEESYNYSIPIIAQICFKARLRYIDWYKKNRKRESPTITGNFMHIFGEGEAVEASSDHEAPANDRECLREAATWEQRRKALNYILALLQPLEQKKPKDHALLAKVCLNIAFGNSNLTELAEHYSLPVETLKSKLKALGKRLYDVEASFNHYQTIKSLFDIEKPKEYLSFNPSSKTKKQSEQELYYWLYDAYNYHYSTLEG